MENKYLVSVETVKIKDYIFSCGKLKVIRGASYLLDFLNQNVVSDILKENQVSEKNILYIGAGNAKFFVNGEDKAIKVIDQIKKSYKKYAPGSKIVGEYIEKKDLKVWDAINKLAQKTSEKKSEGFRTLNIDLPFIKKCDICSNNPVEIKASSSESYRNILDQYNDLYGVDKKIDEIIGNSSESGEICCECFAKLVGSSILKEDRSKVGFYHLAQELPHFEFGETISDYASEKSFIGFVYADGDGLGDFLKNVGDNFKKNNSPESENKYIEFMGEFSKRLDDITKKSLVEALKKLETRYKADNNGDIFYGEFLIVGGDDVCGIFPANLGLEITTTMQKIFETEMAEYELEVNEKYKEFGFNIESGRNNITTSSGVLIAKDKTPLHYLFDLSLELQKSAKGKRIKDKKTKSKDEINHGYIDFQVIGSEGTVNIKEFRSNKENLMERPYCVSNKCDGEKVSKIEDLIQLIEELKEANFPKNKLRKFYNLKLEDEKIESLFEFMNFIGRLDKDSKKVIMENWIDIDKIDELNFEKMLKNIFDVLEIYSFVGEKI